MGHAENYSARVAERMREIADYQARAVKDERAERQLTWLVNAIQTAISQAPTYTFGENFDVQAAALAARRAGNREA